MRVLIINTSERIGGAAIAASRLMESLKNNGIKAKMLVRDKQTDQMSVVRLKKQLVASVEVHVGTDCDLECQPFPALPSVRCRHRQHRYRHHLTPGIPPGRRDPSALDQPGNALTERYTRRY